MNIDIYKLGEKYNLTESEELAFNFIINNIEKSLDIGVRGVAKECFTSTSVIMNLSKKLGYKGFIDMIYRIEKSLKISEETKEKNKKLCLNYNDEKANYFQKLLEKQKHGPIFLDGKGFSSCISLYMKHKLMVLGYFAMISEFMESVEKTYNIPPILIVVSKSGETPALIQLCQKATNSKVNIISFTGVENSTVEKISTINFLIKDSNLLDDRNLEFNDFFGNCILFFEQLLSQ